MLLVAVAPLADGTELRGSAYVEGIDS